MSVPERIIRAESNACRALAALQFEHPVTHVYNPLEYASKPHRVFVRRFAAAPREILFLGMNPGPFGMAQTGIPFGEIAAVRDWMGICEPVGKPPIENPKRPIEGFNCARSEISGQRLWGWAASRFANADTFFEHCYVHNYCPLVFMADSGRNITPDKLPVLIRNRLFEICDSLLLAVIHAIEPARIVGVGAFAEQCAERVAGERCTIGRIPHPSPASPAANRDWAGSAERALFDQGIRFN